MGEKKYVWHKRSSFMKRCDSAIFFFHQTDRQTFDLLCLFFAGPTFLWDFTSWGDIYAYPPLSLSFSLHPFLCFCWRDMIISSWAEAEKERRWFFYFGSTSSTFPNAKLTKHISLFLKKTDACCPGRAKTSYFTLMESRKGQKSPLLQAAVHSIFCISSFFIFKSICEFAVLLAKICFP